jgi:hypothetical protein
MLCLPIVRLIEEVRLKIDQNDTMKMKNINSGINEIDGVGHIWFHIFLNSG